MSLEYSSRLLRLISEQTRVEALAAKTAEEGSQYLEGALDQLIEGARARIIDDIVPAEFLDAASFKMWQLHQSLEPVWYLYSKYYWERIDERGALVGRTGFTDVMAKIAESLEGEDRITVLDSTVRFITNNEPDLTGRIETLILLAQDLKTQGLPGEASQIARFLNTSTPKGLMDKNRFTEEIHQILS